MLSCSIKHPHLRSRSLYLKVFWQQIEKKGFSDLLVGDLISAAIDFVIADTLQKNAAIVRDGREIPEHTKRKRDLGQRGDSETLKRIAIAEADGKRFNFRDVEAFKRRMIKRVGDLESLLEEVAKSPTLSCIFGDISLNGDLTRISIVLQDLRAAVQRIEDQPSQSDLHTQMRRTAVFRMVEATKAATGKPCWGLIQSAVHLASGEILDLSLDTFRGIYSELSITSK